jgi:uncharacterized protein (DUF1810 family)
VADDPDGLGRFVEAQDAGGSYERAVTELRQGTKRSHWMWFVFPQIAGLGRSATAQRYALASLEEARAYGEHALLGTRLLECAGVLMNLADRTAPEIFGPLDSVKLRSSMTLFMRAIPEEPIFGQVLERYFEGLPDTVTDRLLDRSGNS